MIAYVDIENAKTQDVITLELNIVNKDGEDISFDISELDENSMKILIDAINPELKYTDIEMFFIDDDNIPYFGPDYLFSIKDTTLYGKYIRDQIIFNKNKDA